MDDTTTSTTDEVEALARLREIVSAIRIAMITTESGDGSMQSRPMYLQEVERNGDLWFATSGDSSLVEQVRDDTRVTATFANPSDHLFAVVRGRATLHHDLAKVQALWNPAMKAWFPGGPADPAITLVCVRGEHGDYWDAPGGPGRLVRYVAALVTGTRADGGERVHIALDPSASPRTTP